MSGKLERLFDFVLSQLGLDIDAIDVMKEEPLSAIRSDIYLGSRPGENGISRLEELGITHVVSCLNSDQASEMSFLGNHFEHLFLGVRDAMREDISTSLVRFFEFTEDLPHHPHDSKVLVHCEVGVSRSAAFVIALLMKLERKRFYETYLTVRSKRGQILPNIGFASQLQRLEHDLLGMPQSGASSSLALYLRRVCNLPAELDIIEEALARNECDAVAATLEIFGGDIPRVVQGAKRE